jgi:hypothetical protein
LPFISQAFSDCWRFPSQPPIPPRSEHKPAFSRRDWRPRLASFTLEEEGAGNAGCTLHPRSRVQFALGNAHTSIQVQTEHSGIPCAMALRLMPCSPRRRIRLVTVVGGSRLIKLGRVDAASAQLGTSNGCQDHTVLPYASAPYVLRAMNRSRIDDPPCDQLARRRCRVHHIPHQRP